MSVPVLSRLLIATGIAFLRPPQHGDRALAMTKRGREASPNHNYIFSGHLPGSSQREARAKPQARAPLSHRTVLTPHGSSHGAAQPQPHAVQDPAGSTPSATKALGPTLRANPCPEVTDPFCRLPLPTLSHWPEAFHLGDLMRL